MTVEIELGALVKKIEGQGKDIVDKIINSETSKNLQQIEIWIKQQINNEVLSNNIQLLAIIIDIIYQYFRKKSNQQNASLIESCLINLISNWSNLPDHKILAIASYLKVYAQTNDSDAQSALEEFILSGTQSTSNAVNYKKKIKTRIIEFDQYGKGYEFFYEYRCFLNDINLEVELPVKIKKEILRKKLFREELKRLAGIEIDQESYLNKLKRKVKVNEFSLFASQEEKDARKRYVNEKIENTKKFWQRHRSDQKKQAKAKKISKLLKPEIVLIRKEIDRYKKIFDIQSLSLGLSSLARSKDNFLVAFLKTINYENLKKLIMFSEHILIVIDKMKKTLKKIDDFSEGLGISSNYIDLLDYCYSGIKKNFNRESISNFLEKALVLFEQKTLTEDNNYCLLNIQTRQKEIVFSEPDFLDEFIFNNNNEKIFKLLFDDIKQSINRKRKNIAIIRNKNYKRNLIKNLIFYFSQEYYFISEKCKKKLMKKVFSNSAYPLSIESIKIRMDNLGWWQFFLIGINLIYIIKKGFRARLSEELFLDSLEAMFKTIDKKPNPKNIDALYSIQKHINSLNNKIQDHLINLNSLNVLDSRRAVVDKLKNHEKIKDLVDNVLTLSNQVLNCINEFYNLKDACRRESEKIEFDFSATNYFSNIPESSEMSQLNENTEHNSLFFSGKR